MIWYVSTVKGNTLHTRVKCSKRKLEKLVQQIKVERNVSLTKARNVVESSSPTVKDKSYTAAVKVSTSNITFQIDLTWSNSEDK